jgi:hypothetical protein
LRFEREKFETRRSLRSAFFLISTTCRPPAVQDRVADFGIGPSEFAGLRGQGTYGIGGLEASDFKGDKFFEAAGMKKVT